MREDFLHHLWRHQGFSRRDLRLTDGRRLSILQAGFSNAHAGPDFREARLAIEGREWAGQIEIHLRASDWYRHGHQEDPAYEAVVLHVVYEADRPVFYRSGEVIPTLVLKGRFDEHAYWRYEQLLSLPGHIPCASLLPQVDKLKIELMMERCMAERLSEKAADWGKALRANRGDWQETLYQAMARALGVPVNAVPMAMLAERLPRAVLLRLGDHLEARQALLLGMAGLLAESPRDEKEAKYLEHFRFFLHKWKLQPLPHTLWKYARLRPAAFPDARLAIFATWWSPSRSFDLQIGAHWSLEQLLAHMQGDPGAYWQEHYRLGQKTPRRKANLGVTTARSVLINAFLPVLFLFGRQSGQEELTEKAWRLLAELPPEDNQITRNYRALGFPNLNAGHSQALLQLHARYCQAKKCLTCSIGMDVLNRS